jgi:Helix-turn-helix domain
MQKTQKEKILEVLGSGRKLTQKQARATYKIQSLSSRVSELRDDGHQIDTVPYTDKSGHTVVQYVMK